MHPQEPIYPKGARTFKPINWPQEKLTPPPGYGNMPDVYYANQSLVRREFYVFGGQFTDISYGETQTLTLPVPQFGDFWMASMLFIIYDNVANAYAMNIGWSTIKIRDLRSGYQLFRPYARINRYLTASSVNATSGQPADRGELIEPYCFVRNSGIAMECTFDAKTIARNSFTVYFALDGWLEYAHVSR